MSSNNKARWINFPYSFVLIIKFTIVVFSLLLSLPFHLYFFFVFFSTNEVMRVSPLFYTQRRGRFTLSTRDQTGSILFSLAAFQFGDFPFVKWNWKYSNLTRLEPAMLSSKRHALTIWPPNTVFQHLNISINSKIEEFSQIHYVF